MKSLLNERKQKVLEFKKIVRKREFKYKPIDIPDHIFSQCEACMSALYNKELELNLHVCPYCGHHFRIGAKKRLQMIVDEDSITHLFKNIEASNPLLMPGYEDKLSTAQKFSGLDEALICASAKINKIPVYIAILDSQFMMGSMGSVVGEKLTRLIELSEQDKLPLIIFSASGGARMQEGILSLMQMAKTSAALSRLNQLYISVMTNPTTGGVAASFAALGDINIAEKTALIGFAGPRVIKQTIGEDLPEGFQTENFQLEKGQVDLIVHRKDMKSVLTQLLTLHQRGIYE
ncbi:Acetyl-coenzyme A carboxylase carboxyl transferase subunit beta [Alteracholeplasma palmae J233]|uniref:Acetyl-coenzyme A carboxylase carboxyl transferase subunit beta n=1 Tax=Alteracholeplasma palmae (strain ATCC 49389 / J233) TaxID=1318466 RepID=U4KL95_ALTPJ|nr:acetyl-CoA carboxylase, carboxyltransferase subunit beta [Alteracholeplasma palmae]CCV64674.1 Acetyl-coenzyme A carboxylase carboxyl transferase subunit beta [Alteracholeplasma palmae J233]